MTCLVSAFREVMQSVYGPLDFHPIPDGKIHRFHVPDDKPRSRNGWYVLHLDGIASGAFGSWKAGDSHGWSDRTPTDPTEARLQAGRVEQAKRQREAERHQRHQQAAIQARRMWLHDSTPADADHPYLANKRIKAHDLHQSGDTLLIPLVYGGRIVNLQRIQPDGSKWFLPGGRVKGCYSPIGNIEAGGRADGAYLPVRSRNSNRRNMGSYLPPGKPGASDRLYLCEGWATGATIHEHTGAAVACAMNCGNLLDVGRYLQRTFPDAVLIVAGDDDRRTKGNPGRTAAIHAATALGCGMVMPQWTGDEPMDLSDFNDLHCWRAAA